MRTFLYIFSAIFILIPFQTFAGNLDPTDPPGSTMTTLDHIYDQNEEILRKLID